MDPARNPFAPGAGSRPPELAGREGVVEDAEVALRRVLAGRPDRGQFLLGLRGVGKTVLLNRFERMADELGYQTIIVEAPEDRDLARLLAPELRRVLMALSKVEKAKDLARRGLGAVRAFASAFKVTMGDYGFEVNPEHGTADSGTLERDLPELMLIVAEAAGAAESGVALFIDEMQYLSPEELSALIVAAHRVSQRRLPLIWFGAGLPQLAGFMGDAKSYAERLFRFPRIGPLDGAPAREAVRAPIEREGAAITEAALDRVIEATQGYPYFLQEWGSHAWNAAERSPISPDDVARASASALRSLDQDFFNVRFSRLTAREKEYMRAMAELGPGPHRSGDIARELGVSTTIAGPLRTGLIRKGMIYSEEHGSTAFTVPMFDGFMQRVMPAWPPPDAGASPPRGRPPRRKG